LIWRLTGGRVHACDAGNASRTLLYDVVDLAWSAELCALFEVPIAVLPDVRRSDGSFGEVRDLPGIPDGTPIVAVLADSHAALFGQGCTTPGLAKATYGTGTSVMTPVAAFVGGDSPVPATLAWMTDQPTFAREGNILSSGSTLAWTAELLGLEHVSDLVELAADVGSSAGVILVPAFTGLGAPHWDRTVQASVTGLTSGSTRAHVARAAIEAVAHQVCDVVDVIEADGKPLTALRADGGATASALLMQTQADLLGRRLEVADIAEVSALGAAQLGWSGLGHPANWAETRSPSRSFEPGPQAAREARREAWRAEVAWSRTRSR
jgi:glycerol kinase